MSFSRRNRFSYYEYYQQPTDAQKRATAESALKAAAKNGLEYHPVIFKGNTRSIASTWWGQSWCINMERYADFSNRLARGKSYLRSNCVLDLNISKGRVDAKVSGSSLYSTVIRFDPLPAKKEKELADLCSREIQNVETLLSGKFPESLKAAFLQNGGLFPTPKEIHFDCSCPDWASMCKHVAAVMYGIALRLDEDPMKFFELRGIDIDSFVTRAIENKVDSMLKNASKKSKRIMDEKDIEGLFGVL